MYEPVYRITPYLLNLIDEAGTLRSWIENATLKVAWLPTLQKESRIKKTRASTNIEGNPLSLIQVEAIEKGERIGVPQIYEREVKNYLAAMRWIERYASSKISEKSILQLHKILTQDILKDEKCGKYKSRQNYVVNERGIRIYTPPSPEETPKLMGQLIEWLNSGKEQKLHSILVCAIFHHRLVSIHPFSDGNGRIARVLTTWILYQRGFDINHIFSLDDFFASDRKRYYQKIEQAREIDNNLTFWIEYVAEGIIKTLQDVKKRIEGLQVYPKIKVALSPRQEEILRILRDMPFAQVNELQKKLKLTRSRINQLLTPLIKDGLVRKEGQSKATRYSLNKYAKITL